MDFSAEILRKPRVSRTHKLSAPTKLDERTKRRIKQAKSKMKVKQNDFSGSQNDLLVESNVSHFDMPSDSSFQSKPNELTDVTMNNTNLELANTDSNINTHSHSHLSSSSSTESTNSTSTTFSGLLPKMPAAHRLKSLSSGPSDLSLQNHDTPNQVISSHDIALNLSNTMSPMRISNNNSKYYDSDNTTDSLDNQPQANYNDSIFIKHTRSSSPTLQNQQPKPSNNKDSNTPEDTLPITSLKLQNPSLILDSKPLQENTPAQSNGADQSSSLIVSRKSFVSSSSPSTSLPTTPLPETNTKQEDDFVMKDFDKPASAFKKTHVQPTILPNGIPLTLGQSPFAGRETPGTTIPAFELPKNRKRNKKSKVKHLQKLAESQLAIVKSGRNITPPTSEIKVKQTKGCLSTEYDPEFLIEPSNVTTELSATDLRDLVLYMTTPESQAPGWIGIKENFAIPRVVCIYIPSLTYLAFNENTNDNTSSIDIFNHQPQTFKAPRDLDFFSNTFNYAFVVSTPGNKHTYFSSTESFLWMPASPQETKLLKLQEVTSQSSKNKRNNDSNKSHQCLPLDLILSLEELIQHKYPIHPDTIGAKFAALNYPELLQSPGPDWVDTYSAYQFKPLQASNQSTYTPKVFAIDCEMCKSYDKAVLTRVTVVAENGNVIIDQLVKPDVPITDYVTQFSGITFETLRYVNTRLQDVQRMICNTISSYDIMIGHSLENDLEALKIRHPRIIDTAVIYQNPTRGNSFYNSKPALRNLTRKYLQRSIQTGGSNGHDSVEDALACLDLFKLKIKHGAKFGLEDSFSKISLADRIVMAGPKPSMVPKGTSAPAYRVAVVDYGVQFWAKSSAQSNISCFDDNEIGRNTAIAAKNHVFTWARMRELEVLFESMRKPRKGRGSQVASTPIPIFAGSKQVVSESEPAISLKKSQNNETENKNENTPTRESVPIAQPSQELLSNAYCRINARLKLLYMNLPTNTALIIWTGKGDKRRMMELHAKRHQFNHEYKTKKWKDISCVWTDEDSRDLDKATEMARKGLAFLAIKKQD